jgi:replicative DNA helicase
MNNVTPLHAAQAVVPSLEIEQGLIGAIFNDNDVFGRAEGLLVADFAEPGHVLIMEALAAIIGAGSVADPVNVDARLIGKDAYDGLGGVRYLAELLDKAPVSRVALSYVPILRDAALRRRLAELGRLIALMANDREYDALDNVATAEKAITELARGTAPDDINLIDARSSVNATLAEMKHETEVGKAKGKMTGLRCFDRRLRGLRPGHLIIIGGRPSMAKTALARVAAFGCAARNPHDLVAFFALEMDRRELDERTLAQLSHEAGDGVAYQDMSSGKLDRTTLRRLDDLSWKVPANFIIDDSSSLTVDYIKRRVWALKRRGNLVAVFVDYLQIMDRPEAKGRNEASVIGQMTAGLKQLARAANVCVVLLSQINRGVEQRDDKRPQLSDLRESGSIEQDANAVLFPFREVYYLERAEPKADTAEHSKWQTDVEVVRRRMDVICAKNRGGAVGMDRQEYFAEFDCITDVKEDRQ